MEFDHNFCLDVTNVTLLSKMVTYISAAPSSDNYESVLGILSVIAIQSFLGDKKGLSPFLIDTS